MKRIYLLILAMFIGVSGIFAQNVLDKSIWTITADSEEVTGEGATNGFVLAAIDGDPSTFWHTQWAGANPPYPHEFIIDMQTDVEMFGFKFVPRQNNGGGVPSKISFYTSADSITWDQVIDGKAWDAPYTNVVRFERFHKTARYVKLVGDEGPSGAVNMHCGEFDLLAPDAVFSADVTTLFIGGTVAFTDESTDTPVEWKWEFEGGTPATSTAQNPTVDYADAGTYDVQLVSIPVPGDDTKNDTLLMADYIKVEIPRADFTADITTISRGESVTFTDESENLPVEWKWEFEGGTPATSTEQNPTVVYNGVGSYDVKLIAITASGADYANDTITKSDYILIDLASISQADWTVVYIDSELGAKPITNAFDGDLNTFWHDNWQAAVVPGYPHTLILDLGANYEMEGFSYAPRSATGGNGTIDEYQIYITKDQPSNLIDGTWETPVMSGAWTSPWGTIRNEFFTTPKIGRYVIFYMLSDYADNATNATCAEFNIKGSLYGASFSANKTEIYASQSIKFTDQSKGSTVWEWDFEGGDPLTSAVQNPEVKYAVADTFDVQLVMTPQSGATFNDTLNKGDYIVVKPTPVAKSLAKDAWSVAYQDSEEVPTDGLAIYTIDNDPTTIWHTAWYNQTDPYPHEIILNLGSSQNMVGFEYVPRSGGGNGTVAQYELMTSLDAETYVLADSGTWVDSWGDTRTQMFTTTQSGQFVKFLAKSEKAGGAWASCAELNILIAIEGAEFGSSETFVEKGGAIDFVDFSAGDPTAWAWTFEGGTPATSTEQSPNDVVYNGLGTFAVTLTTTGGTAPGAVTKTDYITVDFKVPSVGSGAFIHTVEIGKVLANYSASEGGYVDKLDISTTLIRGEIYPINIKHDEPWGGYDTRQGVWVDWNQDGVYDVATEAIMLDSIATTFEVPADAVLGETRMRVMARLYDGAPEPYANIGYGEIEEYTIVVAELAAGVPVADFSSDEAAVCAGMMVHFTDMSTNTPTSWAWTFEGGTPATSDLQNPMVVFEAGGTFDVSVTATQTSGSDDEAKTDMITANDLPTVSAGDDMDVCYGEDITLAGSGAATYEWDNDVVDGTAFTAVAGSYVVTGTDANECAATDTVDVTVEAQIDFTVTEGDGNLTVDAIIGAIQWVDCSDDSNVAGATGAQFVPEVTGDYAVVVTVGDCSAKSTCYNVVVTGIEHDFERSISIYPNPSTGMINVAVAREEASIKVYNMLGELVHSRVRTSDIEQIELTTKGLYIIQIKADDNVYTGKLVVE